MRQLTRAQSSVEYLMIIGITLAVIVPAAYFFFRYSSSSSYEIVDSQLNNAGLLLLDQAKTVYYSGSGSKLVVEIEMPRELDSAYILGNRELVFNVTSPLGTQEMVFYSPINITTSSCVAEYCDLSQISGIGLKRIRLESVQNGNQVLISTV